MKGYVCGEIGMRAAEEMLRRDKPVNQQLRELGLGKNLMYGWTHGICDPRAGVLRAMAFAGYDVMYIITGKRSKA